MAVRHKTLSNRTVAALTVERDTVFWDRDLTGFGVRVYPSGGKVYIAQARERTGKKLPKRVTVGRYDVLNADRARQRAALILARIRGRARSRCPCRSPPGRTAGRPWPIWRRAIWKSMWRSG
ncbi:MAG: Arm DNA-binding domain-containing protein [Alphaproteobacteria bacterium]|nr:Arm DNA-binding domain-containing protein [Alphaproteobacteria bacterium]